MKLYNVVWEERHSVKIIAENEEEAIEMVHDENYDEEDVEKEISSPPEAYELEEVKE